MHVPQQSIPESKFFKLDSRGTLQEETSDDEADTDRKDLVRKSLGSSSQACSVRKSLGESSLHPILAQLGDPQAALEAIQRQILLERNRYGPQTSTSKRVYQFNSVTIGNGTFQHIPLSTITQGVKTSDRTDDVICAQTVTIQLNFIRTYTVNAAAVVTYSPTLRWVLWRDKVPATVGTATATLATSTNPPSSNVEMYSRLGNGSVNFNSVAVRSPDTLNRYHVYKTGIVNLGFHNSPITPTVNIGTSLPYSHHHDIHHDLHNVELTFKDEAASAPMLNALYFSFFSDMDYTGANYTDTMFYATDLAFRDKQL